MGKRFTEYSQFDLSQVNKDVLKKWDENQVFAKSMTERDGCPSFVFFEGPPSANGMPGIHHVMARTIKDIFCRYKTMKGYQVKRKAGWNTHGLPEEMGVEKALGNTKPDTPKIAGNFFANKFTIHLSKNHPFGGPDNQSPDFDGTVENSANGSVLTLKMKSLKYLLLPIPFMIFVLFLAGLSIYDYFCNENLASLIFSIVPILLFAGVWILIFTKLNRQYKKMKNFIEEFFKDNITTK